MEVRVRGTDLGIAFRADAQAEGTTVRIGGWECLGGTPASRSRWFAVDLNKKNAPWIYAKGEPYRVIAALELYTTLVSLMVFGPAWPRGCGSTIILSGLTDNLGNTFCLSRLMKSKFPLLVILTELAAQVREMDLNLELFWTPRDQNEEADALTNGDFSAFDPSRRIPVNVESLAWKVLPRMMGIAGTLYQEVKTIKEQKKNTSDKPGKRRRPEERLRQRDPW